MYYILVTWPDGDKHWAEYGDEQAARKAYTSWLNDPACKKCRILFIEGTSMTL